MTDTSKNMQDFVPKTFELMKAAWADPALELNQEFSDFESYRLYCEGVNKGRVTRIARASGLQRISSKEGAKIAADNPNE